MAWGLWMNEGTASSYSSDTVWTSWTDTGTSTASGGTCYTWKAWTSGTVTVGSDATVSNTVWVTWVGSSEPAIYSAGDRTYNVWENWIPAGGSLPTRQLTEEEVAENKRKLEEQAAKRKKEEEERAKAEKERAEKAKALLKMVLDEQQKKQLEEKAFFELTSVKSGRRYRIRKGDCRNIEEIDAKGNKVATLCFHPKADYAEKRGTVHHYDTMTIQKLMLENEEDEARQIANISRVVNG